MKYTHIFWDWNGTLLDDAKASWLAVNDMLTNRKLPLITFENYRDYIDIPIIRFYERVMDVSKETMEGLSVEFNRLYRHHLDRHHLGNPSLNYGIVDVLEKFNELGWKDEDAESWYRSFKNHDSVLLYELDQCLKHNRYKNNNPVYN